MKLYSLYECSFSYGSKQVLTDISAEVNSGDFIAVMGPSGAGKSTLLKLLSRDISPAQGRVLFAGQDISSYRPGEFAKKVSVVHQQQDSLLPFTVKDYVLMGRYPHLKVLGGYQHEDYDIAASAIEEVGISHLAERNITALSGGEVQLVVLARAMCQGRDVILLDEPVAHLDPALSRKVFSILKRLHEQGAAVLVVAHDINLAAGFADTFWAMKQGEIIKKGSGDVIFTSESIKEIYNIDCIVGEHPVSQKPVVYL